MTARIVDVETIDVRFPTSKDLDGSDAMNDSPDYSAAYVVLRVGGGDKLTDVSEGHGFTFTIGRGNDLAVQAARAIGERAMGLSVAEIVGDLGGFSRHLLGDSQLRWLGPDKGAIHLGTPRSSTPPGIWPPSWRASRCGSCSPTSRRSSWWTWWTGATSRTR